MSRPQDQILHELMERLGQLELPQANNHAPIRPAREPRVPPNGPGFLPRNVATRPTTVGSSPYSHLDNASSRVGHGYLITPDPTPERESTFPLSGGNQSMAPMVPNEQIVQPSFGTPTPRLHVDSGLRRSSVLHLLGEDLTHYLENDNALGSDPEDNHLVYPAGLPLLTRNPNIENFRPSSRFMGHPQASTFSPVARYGAGLAPASIVPPLLNGPHNLGNLGLVQRAHMYPQAALVNPFNVNPAVPALAIAPPGPVGFRPNRMLQEQQQMYGQLPGPSTRPLQAMNTYHGDPMSVTALRTVKQLADAENCTLWLQNIPHGTPERDIFDLIHTGAVHCLHMHPPDGYHSTCAAKLSFMTPESSAEFYNQANNMEGFWLYGYRLNVQYNRVGHTRNTFHQSRVLVIEGPDINMLRGEEFGMTQEFWMGKEGVAAKKGFFGKYCTFRMDRWRFLPCNKPGMKRMEFRFVRVDGQAQSCLQAIQKERAFLGVVNVWYGHDPCAH